MTPRFPTRLLFLVLAFWLGTTVSAQNAWWNQVTGPAYQVLVYSFADSDGDGWGDLNGLTNRLDEIASLGVQTLWLSPIHPAASYHGYDVMDYQAIDPKLGSPEDFEKLIRNAHKKGFHVLLDMVFNHSSSQHPWFQSLLEDPAGPYREYYQLRKPGVTYGQTSMGQWYKAPATPTFEYFSAFWDQMPDLNNASPTVLEQQKQILRFWLDRGVDGFRFDAAKEIFNSGEIAEGANGLSATRAYWNELRAYARSVNPEVFFLGEAPANDALSIKAYASALDSLFDFPSARVLTNYAASGRDTGLAALLDRNFRSYRSVPGFLPAPFLTNHDQDRAMSLGLAMNNASGSQGWGPSASDDVPTVTAKNLALQRAKVQAALSLTLPGMVFVYYGEELGMTGRRYANDDVARRDAMPWGDDKISADTTTWMDGSSKREPAQNRSTPPWAVQAKDPQSLLATYQAWGKYRQAHPTLAKLGFSVPEGWKGLNEGTLVGYLRDSGLGEVLLVTANLGEKAQAFQFSASTKAEPQLTTGKAPTVKGRTVTLAPFSVTVWSFE